MGLSSTASAATLQVSGYSRTEFRQVVEIVIEFWRQTPNSKRTESRGRSLPPEQSFVITQTSTVR